jgi:hypothetical protein
LVHATAGGELFETWVMLNERFLQSIRLMSSVALSRRIKPASTG